MNNDLKSQPRDIKIKICKNTNENPTAPCKDHNENDIKYTRLSSNTCEYNQTHSSMNDQHLQFPMDDL